jgi:hypothetical protein
MLILFVSLLLIYLRLDIGKSKVSIKEKLCINLPFSIYIGWITVATIANVTAVLVTNNFDGFGIDEPVWTMLVIAVAILLTVIVLIIRKDIAYSLVVVWALLGIFIKRSADDAIYGIQNDIANTALAGIIIIAIFIIGIISYKIYKNPKMLKAK